MNPIQMAISEMAHGVSTVAVTVLVAGALLLVRTLMVSRIN